MRRTSSKAFIVSIGLFVFGYICIVAAEAHYKNIPNKIIFSGGGGRDWNLWDYAGISSFVLCASLFVVGLMFADKED